MADEPRFRSDLFHGIADDYRRFRLGYPAALLDEVRARVELGPDATVLDLACGTGQIGLAIAPYVAHVLAVDQEPDMVEVGRRAAEEQGLDNIRWSVASAEDVVLAATYDLVTIGNAFHRLDRERVARRLVPHLTDGGGIALLWSGPPSDGDAAWQQVLQDTIEEWQDRAGTRDRVPDGWAEAIERDPHADVLRRAGLADVETFELTLAHVWTIEGLTGFLLATSFLSRAALGGHAGAFETDLRERLLACDPGGAYAQQITYAVELARRRT
jgi:SAM-dependent methyltransferase